MRLDFGRGHFPAYRLLLLTPTRLLTVLPRTDPLVRGVTLVVLRVGVVRRVGVLTVLRVGVVLRMGVRVGVLTVLRVGVVAVLVDLPTPTPTRTLPVLTRTDPPMRVVLLAPRPGLRLFRPRTFGFERLWILLSGRL